MVLRITLTAIQDRCDTKLIHLYKQIAKFNNEFKKDSFSAMYMIDSTLNNVATLKVYNGITTLIKNHQEQTSETHTDIVDCIEKWLIEKCFVYNTTVKIEDALLKAYHSAYRDLFLHFTG